MRKNRCNKAGLTLNTVENVLRSHRKNRLISKLRYYNFNQGADFIHELIRDDNVVCPVDTDKPCFSYSGLDDNLELDTCFDWSTTPQGFDYWIHINKQIDAMETLLMSGCSIDIEHLGY